MREKGGEMKYTAEEVRARVNKAWQNHDEQGRVFITMGDAMALVETILPERIKADEGAVTDVMRRVRDASLFSDANALADWLETLHECHADGAVNARKWEPAQIAAKAVRESAQPAERIKADEGADGNDPITEYYEDRNRNRSQGGFTHPRNAQTKPAQAAQSEAAWLERLKDPATVHALMLRGVIAIPSIRSMVDLRGEVPNGEEVQLLRIAELQEQLAAQPRAVPDVAMAVLRDLNMAIGTNASGAGIDHDKRPTDYKAGMVKAYEHCLDLVRSRITARAALNRTAAAPSPGEPA